MNKLDEYTDVLSRLVAETVACTPGEWSRGRLTIVADGVRINYKLKNEGEPGTASISELLRDLIDELYVRMDSHGDTWVEANLDFRLDGEKIEHQSSFKYVETSVSTPPPKKPWWKFGGGNA